MGMHFLSFLCITSMDKNELSSSSFPKEKKNAPFKECYEAATVLERFLEPTSSLCPRLPHHPYTNWRNWLYFLFSFHGYEGCHLGSVNGWTNTMSNYSQLKDLKMFSQSFPSRIYALPFKTPFSFSLSWTCIPRKWRFNWEVRCCLDDWTGHTRNSHNIQMIALWLKWPLTQTRAS